MMNSLNYLPIPKTALFAAAVAGSCLAIHPINNLNYGGTMSNNSFLNLNNSPVSSNALANDRKKRKFSTPTESVVSNNQVVSEIETVLDSFYIAQNFGSRDINHVFSFEDSFKNEYTFPNYYRKNYHSFLKDFEEEVNSYPDWLSINNDLAKLEFNYVSLKLAEIESSKSLVELAPDDCVQFTLILDNDRTLIIRKPLIRKVDFGNNDIIFTLFQGDDVISANTNDLDAFVKDFKEYLSV